MRIHVGASGKASIFTILATLVLLGWLVSSRVCWAKIDGDDALACETMSHVSAFRDDNTNYDPDFAVAIKEKRWADVRAFLMQGYLLPEGLTARQKARIAQERNSAALIPASAGGDRVIVSRLLRRGADPNTQASVDDYVFPLAWAARCDHPEIVKALLAHGAKVNARFTYPGSWGWVVDSTALEWAVESGARRSVAILLAQGANPRLISHFKFLPGSRTTGFLQTKRTTVLDDTDDVVIKKMIRKALKDQHGSSDRHHR
jgi:hypothetical protein